MSVSQEGRAALYRTIWRWHFYAGLFVIPFILILATTGAIYLFKPQIDRWEEASFNLPAEGPAVSANVQTAAALAAFPGAQFDSYRLPPRSGDAALIHIALADGKAMRDVFVSPSGKVAGSLDPERRWSNVISKIHGQLLAGRVGSWIVELAASWAIVMILTGLYLWWPRGRGLAGVVWPRLQQGKRLFWRDLHAVTGFWFSSLALILLVSGMPWAGVWGDAFQFVRDEMGWVQGKRDWTTGGAHAEHDHQAMIAMQARGVALASLDDIAVKAGKEHLAFPVIIRAPGEDMMWTASSEAQNRPLRAKVSYDMATGRRLSRQDFGDRHVIDRIVGVGIAWHEGQLFGWINQLIGVLTALALMTLAVSGFILWRRRKPEDGLGAPAASHVPAKIRGVVTILLVLALLLPLLALSLVVLAAFDRLLLPRLPSWANWLGVRPLASG